MKKEELQKFVDSFHTMTSILSVERTTDGGIGTIRIEADVLMYEDKKAHYAKRDGR